MATTLTTNIAPGTAPFWVMVYKTFLEAVNAVPGFKDDFNRQLLPMSSGTRGSWTQIINLSKVTAALSSETTNPTAKAAKVRQLFADPVLWGDSVEVSVLAQGTTPDNFEQQVTARLGDQAGRSMHTQLGAVLTGVALGVANGDVAGAVHLVAGGGIAGKTTVVEGVATASASNSTTAYVYGNLTSPSGTLVSASNNWAKGGYIVFIDPTTQNYGLARKIKGSQNIDATNHIFDWTTAINVTPVTGERALVCGLRGTDTTAMTQGTNVLKAIDMRRAARVLRRGKASKFGDGLFHGGFDPDDVFYMQNEGAGSASTAGTFADIFKYTSAAPYVRGEEDLTMFGCRMKFMTEPHTLASTAAVYDLKTDDTGALHCSYVVGQGAAGYAGFSSYADSRIILAKGPDKSDAMGLKDVLSWLTSFAKLPINAQQACVIVGYPTNIE